MANYLIIAGTSEIAQSLVEISIAKNHQIFITGRDQDSTSKLARSLNIPFHIADASDFAQVDEAFKAAQNHFGHIDGVVNCAGSLLLKAAHQTTQNEYEMVVQQNLTTSFAVVNSAGKYLRDQGGSVVLISSTAALTGISNHEAIATAKAGIVGLARSAAATYASNNIRFNVVAPGLVETKLSAALSSNKLIRQASEVMHPLGRIGQKRDIANAIAFFLEPENNWITGQVLAVDGGLSSLVRKAKT